MPLHEVNSSLVIGTFITHKKSPPGLEGSYVFSMYFSFGDSYAGITPPENLPEATSDV